MNINADDTQLHHCGKDLGCVQDEFQLDIDRIQGWLQANRLQLNVFKSVLIN